VGPARFGVFVGTDPQAAAQFQTWLGRPVQDVVDFSARDTWSDIANPAFLLSQWRGTKRRLIYGVPLLPNSLAASKESAMRRGAAGAYDAHFRELAQRLVAGGHENAVLRVGWEFNLKTWAWGIKDHEVFVQFFRRAVTAMRSVPGQRFNINWNPNNGYNPYDAVHYYPGNAFVDSVGVDAYDVDRNRYPYPKKCDLACREERQQTAWDEVIYGGPRGLDFWTFFAEKHGKPFSLPEWSMWDRYDGTGGGDNPLFLEQMKFFIGAPGNRVSFAAYFNRNSQDGRHDLLTTFPVGSKRFRVLFGR
jgi:Glycosyl hydrolase family 26